MTEMPETYSPLPAAVEQFVLQWGNLGDRWGVSRSVSQIHALLYLAEKPLAAEDIASTLGIARSNVSTSLRELQTWQLIRAVPVLGDRRTFYEAETDLWTLVSRIAAGRKARELDPAAATLRASIDAAQDDAAVSGVAKRRLQDMLEFVERTSRWYDQMSQLPPGQAAALMKLGNGIVRLMEAGKTRRRSS